MGKVLAQQTPCFDFGKKDTLGQMENELQWRCDVLTQNVLLGSTGFVR